MWYYTHVVSLVDVVRVQGPGGHQGKHRGAEILQDSHFQVTLQQISFAMAIAQSIPCYFCLSHVAYDSASG